MLSKPITETYATEMAADNGMGRKATTTHSKAKVTKTKRKKTDKSIIINIHGNVQKPFKIVMNSAGVLINITHSNLLHFL